jgi:hypothetical protein
MSKVRFEQPALQAAFLDYVHEVERAAERIQRLDKSLDETIDSAPPQMQQVVGALQALRGAASWSPPAWSPRSARSAVSAIPLS